MTTLLAALHGWTLEGVYLAAGAVIAFVGPRVRRWYDAHTTVAQRQELSALADAMVPWAEQFLPTLTGAAKFKAVVAQLQTALGKYGFSLQEIEAEVQRAYSQAKTSGALAASAPRPAVTAEAAK